MAAPRRNKVPLGVGEASKRKPMSLRKKRKRVNCATASQHSIEGGRSSTRRKPLRVGGKDSKWRPSPSTIRGRSFPEGAINVGTLKFQRGRGKEK